jgi:hypothetical protein
MKWLQLNRLKLDGVLDWERERSCGRANLVRA